MSFPSEREFEAHFCAELEKPFLDSKMVFLKRTTENVDLETLIDYELLTRFLEKTQKEDLDELKIDLGTDWLPRFKEAVFGQFKTQKVFEVLRDGVEIRGRHFNLVYFKPETAHNQDQWVRYNSNAFSYVRQFAFRKTMESIDIVLFLNGLAIVTIELKNLLTGQNVCDAVAQYARRDKSLPIFWTPFLHLASDTTAAKIATQFVQNSADDFVHFNRDIENTEPIAEHDFVVDYLYHDVLRPESLLEIIEAYLFCLEEKDKTGKRIRRFLFPRYHQRRTVINLTKDLITHFKKKKELNKRYLIQHSPGSGKSFTIAVLQKFLRNAHVENEHLFDSTIIVTDRINLDRQLDGTIGSSETQLGVIEHADNTQQLAKFLNQNTKVIVSTIQKFSVKKLDELLKSQKGKRVCFIIDEAHSSQTGKLHKHMVQRFETEEDFQEEIIHGIGKKNYPNAVFIALTATPSDKTIELFGKPFDSYSMDQAEKEGYILNVVENIITYSTLFKLSETVKSQNEYPPLIIAKKLKRKAFENERVIQDKIGIILRVFDAQTHSKIDKKAKVMIVTNSRLAAVKYKLAIGEELKKRKIPYRALVAFSGTVKFEGKSYTEINMNNIKEKIEEEFNKLEYRFLIVANKYQKGFNQPLLHTMFLDKAVSGINAVQTISRLNRIFPGKNDTLTVDFTNSYKAIISAFKKFKTVVNDYSAIDVYELPRLYNKILQKGIFTKADVEEFNQAILQSASPVSTSEVMLRVKKKLDAFSIQEIREFRNQLNKFNDTFKYMDNLLKITDGELRKFALFTNYLARYIDPIGKGGEIDEEIKKIFLVSHQIRPEQPKPIVLTPKIGVGAKRGPVYLTIPEVVESINLHYELALNDNDKHLLRQYVQEIIKDSEIKTDIQANKKNLDKLYSTTLFGKLKERAIQFFLINNPSKLTQYLDKGILDLLNQEAFRLAINKFLK